MIFVLPIFAFLAYVVYICLCYCEYFKTRPVEAYSLGVIASIVSTMTWLYMIRHYAENKNSILYINLLWDVAASLVYVILPIIFFDVKLDLRTSVGCILAIIGLVIAKV
jgi:ABC-type transport system involved in cytochrome c biogenesis permease subunit